TYANEAALFDSDVVRWGGAVQASGTVVVTAGLLLLAVALARRRPPGWASGLLLVPSGPASFFLTPVLPVTGLAWLAAGIALHLTGRPLTAVVSNR
ncbi:MAG TPA: hypothetical protein VD704_11375, partial [Gaiellaceae bacterium]|nr:hypothetical protein [Gaiellaceae bacterium]